jgi:hypothetical protein
MMLMHQKTFLSSSKIQKVRVNLSLNLKVQDLILTLAIVMKRSNKNLCNNIDTTKDSIKDKIKDFNKVSLSLKNIDNIWLKFIELKKFNQNSKDSTLILMVSSETTIMMELGKRLTIETCQEIS